MLSWLLISLCLVVAWGKVGEYKESKVVELTDKNFYATLKQHDDTFVEFYAPWCGHCKKIAPEWEEMAEELDGVVTLAKVDATAETKVAEDFGVQGYPTLVYFKKAHFKIKYSGPLEKKTLLPWAKKQSTARNVRQLDSRDEVLSFTQKMPSMLGLFADGCYGAEYRAFAGFAFENNQRLNPQFSASFPFGCVGGDLAAELAAEHSVSLPSALLYRDFEFEEKVIGFTGNFLDLGKWIEGGANSKLIVASSDTEEKFFSGITTGSAILFIFTRDEDLDIRGAAHRIAIDFQRNEKLKVVAGMANDYGEAIAEQNFNKKRSAFPFAGILEFGETEADDKYFEMSTDFNLDYDGLKTFLYQWENKLLKSEGDPTIVLTSSNFETEVINSNKNVFVEFYAPWCGHCKSLAPVWRILALKYQSNSQVAIAKMDATEHSHPTAKVEGYPTIVLYKKGAKSEPLKFDGNRALDDMVKFIEKETK